MTNGVQVRTAKENEHFGELWIGLAHIRPKVGNRILEDAVGAYAQFVCAASTHQEFVEKAQYFLDLEGFYICDIEDAEPLSSRLAKYDPDDELINAIADMDPNSFVIGTVHSYENADLSDRPLTKH